MNTMLIVGSAPCLFDDVAAALELRPLAEVMAINGAGAALEHVEHLLCGHEEKTSFFITARKKAFPNAQPWKAHACAMAHRQKEMKHMFPEVDVWWPFEMGICSTSASKAAKIAKMMGFEEVILCGSPLDDSGYFEGEGKGVPQNLSCVRVGDPGLLRNVMTPHHTGQYSTQPGTPMRAQESKIVKSYRTRFRQLAEGEFKGWVYSMSGFTREILGYPPQMRN